MFRYYGWLPVDIEPDYREGFTCDKCTRDFLSGPFYHQESTGEDYCTACGEAEGLTPFNGLVCSLLFSDTGEVLRDALTGSLVLFAYQIHSGKIGLYFSDGATALVQLSTGHAPASILSMTYRNPAADQEMAPLEPLKWRERFTWLNAQRLQDCFPHAVPLHTSLPSERVAVSNDVFIANYEGGESGFSLELGGGWQQIFDSESGIELVAKDGFVVTLFEARSSSTHVWTKAEAQQLLDEMTTILMDKS